MHTSDGRREREGERLGDLPDFELRYLLDDGDEPRSVTIYAPEALETTWITVDVDSAVALDEVR